MAWLSERLTDTDIQLLNKILTSDLFTWENRCQIVSGLTLGLQRLFDKEKFKLLYTYYQSPNQQIKLRALVGLVIGFVVYDKRLPFYPEIQSLLISNIRRNAKRTSKTYDSSK